jgi:Zn-dependent M28 family amino/carboxypeptidase
MVLLIACPLAADGQPTSVQLKLLPQETIQRRLETVVPKIAARRATLESLFQEVGCRDERLASQKVSGTRFPNLICTLPGNDPGAGMIVAGAHFDHIGGGIGAVDDWSGVVLLPSLYQSLAVRPRRHTFVFAAFSAEHRDMAGSTEFVYRLSKPQKRSIRAMMNLESLGLTVPQVWALRANKGLLDAYNSVARSMDLDVRVSNFNRLMDDDTQPFLNARIPVITIHSLTTQTMGFHHNPRDQLNAIDEKNYYEAYRLVAAFLAYLDSLPN